MGQSVLKIHQLGRWQFCTYDFDSLLESQLQLPIDDEDDLERFRRDFRLTRTSEPGLSVVIPHYRSSELHRDEVARSIVHPLESTTI